MILKKVELYISFLDYPKTYRLHKKNSSILDVHKYFFSPIETVSSENF